MPRTIRLTTEVVIGGPDVAAVGLAETLFRTLADPDGTTWTVTDAATDTDPDAETTFYVDAPTAIGWRVLTAEEHDGPAHELSPYEARVIADAWSTDDHPGLLVWEHDFRPRDRAAARRDARRLLDDLSTETPETWPHAGEHRPQLAAVRALVRHLS
ncbi:hypothetical protein ACWF9G_22745 [Nocardia sp. NPDC055029]